ncbi:MAG: PIG-L family deacetylase [Bacteroidales bacterium]|nr:PIG-L family deacetylase [Bacteroidales bacterium]
MKNKNTCQICPLMRWFSVCIVLLTFCAYIATAQEYDERADYYYSFSPADATIIDLVIAGNRLELNFPADSFHTAFIGLDIKTRIPRLGDQPKIELQGGNIRAVQYVEYRAKGLRYINLSDFVQHNMQCIQLDLKQCRLRSDSARIILYKNPCIASGKLLVLAPHPDDAEIAAYGLYSANIDAFVVTITVGDAGKKIYDELYSNDTIHYRKKADVRLWNSITIPMLAGLDPQNSINLGYFDATLKDMHFAPLQPVKARYTGVEDINRYREMNISSFLDSLPGSPTWNSLVNDLKTIIERKKPEVIVTPYPAIDIHPDHKLTTLALIQALKELKYTSGELWLYTNHFIHSEIYPHGKAGSLISLPPNTGNKAIFFRRIYSHTLSDVEQSDKALALDAMNMLRPDTEWHTTKGGRRLYMKTRRENRRNTEVDYYYRRAVRNNELFFIVNIKDLYDDGILIRITGEL